MLSLQILIRTGDNLLGLALQKSSLSLVFPYVQDSVTLMSWLLL